MEFHDICPSKKQIFASIGICPSCSIGEEGSFKIGITVPRTPHAGIWGALHASVVRTAHPVTSYGGIVKISKFSVFYSQILYVYGALLHSLRGPGDSISWA